ncbi:hypothetical protein, partial [Rhodospirillum rubrum]|uniref:hypothetical protein n=1 Tax=Rhodospirillum rubrum TaxID=1085 RepID=UPI0028A6E8E9
PPQPDIKPLIPDRNQRLFVLSTPPLPGRRGRVVEAPEGKPWRKISAPSVKNFVPIRHKPA